MKDKDFAIELIDRLNELLEYHSDVSRDISKLLLRARVKASEATVLHPTLQVPIGGGDGAGLGVLGLLNGIAGRITTEGPLKGMGLIAAVVEKDGSITKFMLTEGE